MAKKETKTKAVTKTKRSSTAKKTAVKSNTFKNIQSSLSQIKIHPNTLNVNFLTKVIALVVVGLALFMLAQKYKGLVVAGIVNKTPITKIQLNQMLVKRYGKAVFEEMVTNELIKQEADKLKITVLATEISDELKQLEDRLGGEKELQNALLQYGLTQAELEDQIKLSLLQRKIVETQADYEVSEAEAQEYFQANTASFASQKFDEVKEEIKVMLKDQKMQEAFSAWFADVKAKAQIQSYLD